MFEMRFTWGQLLIPAKCYTCRSQASHPEATSIGAQESFHYPRWSLLAVSGIYFRRTSQHAHDPSTVYDLNASVIGVLCKP
jgi:hypothetical protein